MRDYELDGLMELGLTKKDIRPWRAKTGIQYRVKVRNETGRIVYITDLRSQKKQKLLAKHYNIPLKKLQTHLAPTYKRSMNHYVNPNKHSTEHIYTGLSEDEFWDKLENVVLHQEHALKFDVAIGYTLVNRHDPLDVKRFHPGTHNTSVFKNAPVPGAQSINTRKDAIANMDQLRSIVLEQTIDRPNSSYMLKSIDEFFVKLYHRTHKLGSEEAVIPEVIRQNRHVVNFPQPPQSTKCLFYCIAYHLQLLQGVKRACNRLCAFTKDAVKKWLAFKGVEFTDKTFPSIYKTLPPVDIYHLSDVEGCFKINIEVYAFNEQTQEYSRAIDSSKSYDSTMSILSHNSHAMYITDPERFMGKHGCPKCSMVFATQERLHNHKKNKCQEAYIKKFVNEPSLFRPPTNKISRLLSKYGVKDVDPYTDHYLVYDFEAILKPLDADKAAKRLKFTSTHIPVSVSVHDSLTDEAKCFVSDSPKELLVDMFTHAATKRKLIEEFNRAKYSKLIEKIEQRKQEAQERHKNEPNKITKAIVDKVLSEVDTITRFCATVPLIGFNSGRYDLNIIKDELFAAILQVSGCVRITRRGRKSNDEKKPELSVRAILSGSGYMCLDAGGFKMLDISKYVAAGTSLRQYLKAYLGKCQCIDKTKCTCQMSKGHFPYEYLTSFDKLDDPLPPRSAFNSSLRSTKISDKEWKRVQWVWEHYEMKTLRDLLIWYNNLDVIPFSRAIREQMKFFRGFKLDMFADGVSLPGLAEKIMYQTCYEDENYIQPRETKPPKPFEFGKKRFSSYKAQDDKANRTFNMTLLHLNGLLEKQNYLCTLCYEPLTKQTASVDRINNLRGHEDNNIHITCSSCNCARKDMNIPAFKRKKLLEYNANRLIHSIDEEQSEVYNLMESNIVGGSSIIFNRFAKAGMTRIRGGKLCQKVIGYDANALYLWCLGQDMPCGRLTKIDLYDGLIDDIVANKQFGFIECDIETPEHLKEYFEEMTPILKNTEIDPTAEVIGDFMAAEARKQNKKKSRKLIGSYFGKKILIYTPLLKWYIAHGLVVTKVHSFVKCHAARPFHKFTEIVSNARREGDADKSKEVVGNSMKLIGNSPFGKSAMNQTKHKKVSYESCDKEISKLIEDNLFQGLEELNGVYEVTQRKRTIFPKNPIHVAIAVYQLAKLRMLAFYYDCVDKYIDRSDFQYQEMDTDSGYIAFSGDHPFPDLIKPELREHFEAHKYEWFPRDDTDDNAKFDKRTPGLFKEEWRGGAMVSLSSKNYICYDGDLIKANWVNKKTGRVEPLYHKTKCSAKGIQKSNNAGILTPERFEEVIKEKITLEATNRGFRVVKQIEFFDGQRMSMGPQMQTYEQQKNGCGFFYDKRIVLKDGISTIPLNI